jgi:hypothetical protein
MPELPYGAVLFTAEEVTERMSRRIAKARNKLLPIILQLTDKGYVEPIPKEGSVIDGVTWDAKKIEAQLSLNLHINAEMTDEQIDATNDYQSELILTMVRTWEKPTLDLDSVLDLPTAKFQSLAESCDAVLRGTVLDLEPSIDPKAPPADSLA